MIDETAIEEYAERVHDGMSYEQVREELREKKVSEENIRVVIRLIDDRLIEGDIKNVVRRQRREYYWGGVALLSFGAFATLGTYTGFIDMGNSYLLMYGPIIGGFGMISYSRSA